MSEKLADILVTLIHIFALSREEIRGGRFRRFAKALVAGSDGTIQAAVSKLKTLTESENLLVGAETLTAVKQSERTLEGVSMTVASTDAVVGKISEDVSQLTQDFNALRVTTENSLANVRQERGISEQELVKLALQPSSSALDFYDKINRSRVPETGN